MNCNTQFQKTFPSSKNEKSRSLNANKAKTSSSSELKTTYANITKRNIPDKYVEVSHKRVNAESKPQQISTEDEGLSHSNDIKDCFKYVKNFTRGHFVLFASQREMFRYRDRLALIPWLCVFDFDEHSRSDGLLSVLEDKMKSSRTLYVCTWKDQPRISYHGTQWCLVRGSVQEADSRTESDTKAWFKAIRNDLEKHMHDLASLVDNYTILKVIIIWPDEPYDAEYFQRALNKLDEFVDDYTTIIWDSCKQKTESEKAIMNMLKPDFILTSSLQIICKGIHEILGATQGASKFEYKLPTADEKNSPQIDESTASLLREDLDVLYLDNPYGETDLEVLKKEDESFYKGGNLSWKTFYCFGAGHLDAERDMMNTVVSKISQQYIENFKSGLITIYHAPGCGCTTMVRRILWELKSKTPCAQVRLNQRSNLQSVSQQIETLYDKTNLPIVLLIDGDDQQRVNHLYKLIDHSHMVVILINTKRYPYNMKEIILKENHFALDGLVSKDEASKLWKKFEDKCDTDRKKDNLSQIVEDVRSGRSHSVYEFGLATYLKDYKGIDAYIAGYLEVDDRAGLQPHHKILGYLSLVQYYGHTSIPCQFFVNLLGLPSKSDVTFDDFPYQVQQFAVPCQDEAKGNSIRLCHYVVAKGILEFILSSPHARSKKEFRDKLSPSARENLYSFVVGFIDDVKARRSKGVVKANILSDILTRTIIFRDNRDIGENELQRTRRPNLSRLLSDIGSKPPYLERVNLIKKLTEVFPEDPNFHSHLGRMYSLCRPDDEKEAEKCFQYALELCDRKTSGIKYEDLDESTKHTLKHVFHMAGMFYLQRISKYTGRAHGDKPEKRTTKEQYKSTLHDLLFFSEKACRYFSETRELTMFGYSEAHGFIGEISVRIRLCEFIHRYLSDREFDNLLKKKESDSEEAKYIQDSVIQIQELFLQCYGTIDIDELPQDFFDSIRWYSALFKEYASILENLNLSDNIYQRRLKVAAIKLRYGKEEMLGALENINKPQDIAEIVRICEMNFQDTRTRGLQQSRRALDLEYKDWINAVRHDLFKTPYFVEDVIQQVRYWNDTLQSPNSKFYHFIMLSILGFGLNGTPNDDMLREARGLQEQLKKLSKHLVKPRKPREWLGRGPGLKDILLQGRKVHRNDEDGSAAQRDGGHCHMTVLKGTICRPNIQRQTGYIQLDLGDKNRFPVKVFFVPVRQNPPLVGRQYAGQRVEFVMAFTNADGYEAYNVMQLEKYGCECGLKVEIQSDEYIGTCKCGRKVAK
ncbi:hypothetical protein FSP39_007245 [Pinctada imbricata]|uniref:Sterile alpha motif domain-containing protein 9-like n=1 Tax=Pinctada imbricata TaxID=66713 RepID=A0AA89BQP6_PINIB|nr:hypothetical protein FSP39_007245 [Pinctada imbricata]